MPELPEVESVRLGLERYLPGRSFGQVEVLHPRATRGQDIPLAACLEGHTVSGISRRGKFLWLTFQDTDEVCFIHLGMSGQLRVGEVDSSHVRIRAQMSGGLTLSFVDQRTFGYWRFGQKGDIGHIARDPLDPDFDEKLTARALRKTSSPIKAALLDQSKVSGIGNIYADESLWLAGIKPTRPANRLLQREAVFLLRRAQEVMTQALAQGGTSFDALYVNVNGESGYFDRSLHVYGREGDPCDNCGTPLRKRVVGGRGTHWCPECQD